ncbi:MAG: DUF4339 domain-containing protein [Planctomycetales bacterium]|nr:DUF4339 domain-containing protein [Planctomycetales bacterium]
MGNGRQNGVTRDLPSELWKLMGIKFICDSCTKKLNVKSFLAGKRGVCPHCGCSVNIPLESQVGRGAKLAAAISPDDDQDEAETPIAIEGGASNPNGAAESVATVGLARTAIGSLPTAETVPNAVVASVNGATQSAGSSGGTAVAAAPLAGTVPTAAPFAAAPMATPVSSPMAIAAAVTPARDPISEAPHAVWYVQPPTGGRYGPANGEIMRRWIAEGRVSSDSLVWRDGWPEWRMARVAFPSLGGAPTAPPSSPPPLPNTGSGGANSMSSPVPVFASSAVSGGPSSTSSGGKTPVHPRRRSNSTLLFAVITLCLLTIVLLVALVFVLKSGT